MCDTEHGPFLSSLCARVERLRCQHWFPFLSYTHIIFIIVRQNFWSSAAEEKTCRRVDEKASKELGLINFCTPSHPSAVLSFSQAAAFKVAAEHDIM